MPLGHLRGGIVSVLAPVLALDLATIRLAHPRRSVTSVVVNERGEVVQS